LNSRKPRTRNIRSAPGSSRRPPFLGPQGAQNDRRACARNVRGVIGPISAASLDRPALGSNGAGPLVDFWLETRRPQASRRGGAAGWRSWPVAQRARHEATASARSGGAWNHCCRSISQQAVQWLRRRWPEVRRPCRCAPRGPGQGSRRSATAPQPAGKARKGPAQRQQCSKTPMCRRSDCSSKARALIWRFHHSLCSGPEPRPSGRLLCERRACLAREQAGRRKASDIDAVIDDSRILKIHVSILKHDRTVGNSWGEAGRRVWRRFAALGLLNQSLA